MTLRSGRFGLLILAPVIFLSGCGGAGSPAATSEVAAPKNRLEGMQRIRQANSDHDKSAPANQQSTAPRRR